MGRDVSMAVSMFRWIEGNIFYAVRSVPNSLRWPELGLSRLAPGRAITNLRWPEVDLSVFDNILWTVVVVVETLTLVTAVCFFYVFCGCNI